MGKRVLLGVLWLLAALQAMGASSQPPGQVAVLTIKGGIGPAVAEYVTDGLARLDPQETQLAVLRVDTPGGLLSATRDIVQGMLAAPVPVVVFVSPSGARAASAGTYIAYAGAVTAMAPGTNIGAATPVSLGIGSSQSGKKDAEKAESAPRRQKAVNDATAWLKSLGEQQGHNAQWAEQAVREGASLSAREALKEKVINLGARNLNDLLQQLDGYTLSFQGESLTLETQRARVTELNPTFRQKLLAWLTSPTLVYVLLLVGVYGIIFEVLNPGLIIPGVVGGIALLVAVYGLHLLPVSVTGLLLLVFGMGLMLAETFITSFGILAIGGIASFLLGSLLLFEPQTPGFTLAVSTAIGITLLTTLFFLVVVRMAVRAQKRKKVANHPTRVSGTGTVIKAHGNEGLAHFNGENWQVRASVPLAAGQTVSATGRDGLTLFVEPLEVEES